MYYPCRLYLSMYELFIHRLKIIDNFFKRIPKGFAMKYKVGSFFMLSAVNKIPNAESRKNKR